MSDFLETHPLVLPVKEVLRYPPETRQRHDHSLGNILDVRDDHLPQFVVTSRSWIEGQHGGMGAKGRELPMVASACLDSRTGTQIRNSEASRSVRSSGPEILGVVLLWTALDGEHRQVNSRKKRTSHLARLQWLMLGCPSYAS